MCPKCSLWYKLIALVVALVLIVPILAACGKEKEKTPLPTSTLTATPSPTLTKMPSPTPTATSTPAGPVKIGAIMPWSGPMAMGGVLANQTMAVVEDQVKNLGGILGGREVKLVRGDDSGMVAESAAQAKKLILEDGVIALTLGSVSVAHSNAIADVAEELKVPYVAFALTPDVAARRYSACLYSLASLCDRVANFMADVAKPKTVAFLAYDTEDPHHLIDGFQGVVGAKDRWKAKGIDVVYEQYFPQGTVDFSPYLAKIKYLEPDILVTYLNDIGQAVTINKQVIELGGWGSMKYFCGTEVGSAKAAINMPEAVGTYTVVDWLPGSDDPGMKAFEDAFKQKYGRPPSPELSLFYNCFWTAIKAIELAGTDDPGKVAQALRSGNVQWDSAWGHMRIGANGIGEVSLIVAQVQEGGKLVKVWPQ